MESAECLTLKTVFVSEMIGVQAVLILTLQSLISKKNKEDKHDFRLC